MLLLQELLEALPPLVIMISTVGVDAVISKHAIFVVLAYITSVCVVSVMSSASSS